ncbi:HET-domain-containing protein [Phaeosphaeriaceae sp. SRC1lsM3a]|nr:HET-domain-containing protein [Stagonospora sp. SRC1lsM3a]
MNRFSALHTDVSDPEDRRPPNVGKKRKKKCSQLQLRPYKYKALPSEDSLRILTLRPGKGTEPLDVTLQTFQGASLEDRLASAYAVSYVWGDSTRSRSIYCGKKAFKITASLENALRALRSQNRLISLWADAICINQDDPLERNHQIKLMTQIYSNSKGVLVWLGPDRDGTGKEAFDFARCLKGDSSFAEATVKNWWASRALIKTLQRVSERKWFRRMWTMQEIGLAATATFVCGDSRIDWQDLHFAYDLFQKRLTFNNLRILQFEPSRVTFLYDWMSSGAERSFLEVLVASETRETTDQRDRVFALLSHPSAQTKTNKNQSIRLLVEPDYTKSLEWVYSNMSICLIRASRRLDVLSYVRGFGTPGLPSWAPMWGQRMETNSLLSSHVEFSASSKGAWQYWTDSIDVVPGSVQNTHKLRLTVTSTSVGNVVWCSDPANSLDALAFSARSLIKQIWEELRRRFLPETALPEHSKKLLRNYSLALTCGLYHPQYEGKDGQQRHSRDFAAFWSYIWKGDPQAALVPASNSSPRQFASAAWYAWAGRRLFYTDTGYIGLGPVLTSIGHEVCVLEGGRVPFVLKNLENAWSDRVLHSLVGECFVPGAMHGEFIAATRNIGNRAVQPFFKYLV